MPPWRLEFVRRDRQAERGSIMTGGSWGGLAFCCPGVMSLPSYWPSFGCLKALLRQNG